MASLISSTSILHKIGILTKKVKLLFFEKRVKNYFAFICWRFAMHHYTGEFVCLMLYLMAQQAVLKAIFIQGKQKAHLLLYFCTPIQNLVAI